MPYLFADLPKEDNLLIVRRSVGGRWDKLEIFAHIDGRVNVCGEENTSDKNEDDAVSDLLHDFVSFLGHEHLRPRIIQCLHQLRENDFSGNSEGSMILYVVPKEKLEPHFSCSQNQKKHCTIETSGKNEISQSEVQLNLAVVDKNGDRMKFFLESRCSVCLSNYTEILDDDRHIVVPSCGHPLCCECADNILVSGKQECPRCRGNVTVDSFKLMKFNANLQMETQDQTVFL